MIQVEWFFKCDHPDCDDVYETKEDFAMYKPEDIIARYYVPTTWTILNDYIYCPKHNISMINS